MIKGICQIVYMGGPYRSMNLKCIKRMKYGIIPQREARTLKYGNSYV